MPKILSSLYVASLSKIVFISLVILVPLSLVLIGRTGSRATAQHNPVSPQSYSFAYWSESDGFNSLVSLNNASNTQLTVHPVLYDPTGRALAINPVHILPNQHINARIADWIAENGGDRSFKQGSLSLHYEAQESTFLGAQVLITNSASSLSFDVPNENDSHFASSRLEGLWWRHDNATEYNLVLTNTTADRVGVTAIFTGSERKSDETDSLNIQLEPHQTEVVKLDDLDVAFTTGRAGKMGGVTITHTGRPGALLAYGMVARSETGFSTQFLFSDPAMRRSHTLAGTHLTIGRSDLPGFGPQSSFTPLLLLRNSSDTAIEVAPKISYSTSEGPVTVALTSRNLPAQRVDAVDLHSELRRAGHRGPYLGAGLTLTSTGEPGAVVTQCFSYDQTTDHVFYTHLKDPAMSKNRLGGSYPFNLEGDNQCIIQVRNTTDEPARFTFQIDWPGGSYTLPVRVLAPQQQSAIDVRKLRDGQIPDSLGRVIPLEVAHGQTTWNEHSQQALVGRVETYTVMGRMSSTSFSCPTPCCPPVSFIVFCQPGEVSGVPGDTRLVQLFESRRRECDGAEFGPFNITSIATWTSESSSVVEVGSVSESGCELSYESVGQTDIIAQYESVQYQFAPEEGGICSPILVPIIHSCPVQVIDFTLTLSPTGINPIGTGGINTSTVTVQTIPPTANVNVMVSLAEFVDAGGQVIGTGGHLSHTSNRPLGTLSAMQGTTGANGAFQAVYTAPIFGGQIVVNVSIAGGQTNRAEVVEVRVSGLASLGTGTDYNLVGATTTHPDNHWGTIGAINGLVGIAQDYRTQFYGTNSIPNADRLRYNDISLVLGGKFEIAGDWGNGSHAEHRTGINCDVGSNNVPVARRAALEQIFVQRGSPNFLNEGNHWHLRF